MHQEINPISSFKSIQNQIFFTTSTATLLIQATISQASLPQYLASTFSSEPQISSLYNSQTDSYKNLGLIMSLLSSKSSTTLHFTQWEKVLMVGLQFPLWVHSCCFLSAPQPSCCYLNSLVPRALTLAVFFCLDCSSPWYLHSQCLHFLKSWFKYCPFSEAYINLLFSYSVVSDSLGPHGLWHIRFSCPLLSPGVCSYPLSQQCHPTISSSVAPISSCP